ncbi:MAG: hypothetical protein K2O42_03510, partial [Oscillospiraceae bacterium]|nr:hypothetical protein [Oscillospiraceae bacterium]
VHRLPQGEWEPEQEIDFYMDDGKNIYFLRIINCNGNMIQLMDDNLHKNLRWIIVCTQVEDTFAILKKIIKRLKEIPYASKINQKEQGYYLLNWI